jgi:ferric-dicitrate binding protein FerR (iron transport regulator)
MEKEQLLTLIKGYWAGTLDPEQELLFLDWYNKTGLEEFTTLLEESGLSSQIPLPGRPPDLPIHRAPVYRLKKWSAAAAIILLLGASTILLLQRKKEERQQATLHQNITTDLTPGNTGAVLTLADGKRIELDSSSRGVLGRQGNTTILNANGQVWYSPSGQPSQPTAEIAYNTLATGRGHQYAVVLPDGSKAWLNAASSIQYPTAFSDKERAVRISGEVYFEISTDPAKPFVVTMTGTDQRIAVLGTRFNVNAYEDEGAVRTTLLDGSVRVSNGPASLILHPGTQAIAERKDAKLIPDTTVNISQVMAWKNGLFHFDRADIRSVMRQLARWYDVEVEYEGTITEHFGGTISRNVNVSQVFQMLEMTGAAHFVVDGKKIKVSP